MRILQVVHQFLPHHAAGTEIYTYKLSKELLRRGHQVHVFHRDFGHPERGFLEEDGELDGLVVRRVFHNASPWLGNAFVNPRIEQSFRKYASEISADVIHFQHLDNLSPTLPLMAKGMGKPAVMTLADFWLMCPAMRLYDVERECACEGPGGGLRCATCATLFASLPGVTLPPREEEFKPAVARVPWSVKRLVPRWAKDAVKRVLRAGGHPVAEMRAASYMALISAGLAGRLQSMAALDLIIAPSKFIRNLHIAYGVPGEKIIHSDYGFDLGGLTEARKTASGSVRFGYTGTLHAHKGAHVLIDAFRQAGLSSAVLKIFGWGDPGYVESLKRRARGANIEFMGKYKPADVAKVFSEIDVLVVPSLWYENSPLVIHEAFASRTPALVSGIGGMAELVADGKGGMTFEVGSVEDLAAKMRKLAEDSSLRTALAENAPRVKTIEENAQELEEIYGRLISARNAPPTA